MRIKTLLHLIGICVISCNSSGQTIAFQDRQTTINFVAAREYVAPAEEAHMYHVNLATVIPIVVVLGGTSIYLMPIIYSKPATPVASIEALSVNNVPGIDRWTAGWHNSELDKISYYPFYAVMPLPLILLADRDISADKGRIGLMYLEAFAFEGITYTSSVYFFDRYRPDVYNTSLPMDYRTEGNYRNSFFAGHVAVVALSTFFTSKVWNDYHPGSPLRWVFYGGSAAATLGMSYLRLRAGKHFTTDVMVGMADGVACGLLVPIAHKNKNMSKQKWTISPTLMNGGAGLAVTYKI